MKYRASIRRMLPLMVAALSLGAPAHAQTKKEKSAPPAAEASAAAPAPGAGERVDVEEIKERYWARGQEAEVGVVQNRLYSKAGRWQLGVFGGLTLSDPFLAIKTGGLLAGYNFSEYFALSAVFMKSVTTDSTAYNTFQRAYEGRLNDNPHTGYLGLEATGSLLYGKLSLVGAKIIYFDMHATGGLGLTDTKNGVYVTPTLGLGQRIYLNKYTSLRVDYRMMVFRETLFETEITRTLGLPVGQRTNFSHNVSVGVNFFFGAEK